MSCTINLSELEDEKTVEKYYNLLILNLLVDKCCVFTPSTGMIRAFFMEFRTFYPRYASVNESNDTYLYNVRI